MIFFSLERDISFCWIGVQSIIYNIAQQILVHSDEGNKIEGEFGGPKCSSLENRIKEY